MHISELPDRQWLEREYLPQLDGRVLYVGTAAYTRHYGTLATEATEFIFLDVDEETVRRHGGATGICGDFCSHVPPLPYDHVALYGLVGYGTPAARMPELIAHADRLLVKGGTLLLGPDKRAELDDLPPDVRARFGDELLLQLPRLSAPPVEHWKALFALPPLDAYDVIVDGEDVPFIESNYVWWGRKR